MFMENNQNKLYYCTGDIDQRKPFTLCCNNIEDKDKYQLSCINQMFKDQITLKENKRLKSEDDKKRLIQLKNYIFNSNKKVIDTFKKHGIKTINDMKQVSTTKNICLFNFRCDQVNKNIAKHVIKKDGFYKGLEIVCKLLHTIATMMYKTSNIRLYVNYHYYYY